MYEKVKDFILGLRNYRPDLKIAVSYSGGADSGVLLHLINRLYAEKIISIPSVIYFNHGLRGPESAAEEKFVTEVCRNYGFEVMKIKLDVKKIITPKITLETAARNLRHEHYTLISPKFDYIAQGHHADDNAETVFFNILRGSGLQGAAGIRKVRDFFIRPLLSFSKEQILKYAEDNKISYITDSSNMKNDFSRNRIRNIIFPLITKELNREISGSLNSFSESAREAVELVEEIVESESGKILRSQKGLSIIKLDQFIKLRPALKKAVLQKAFKLSGSVYNPDRIKTGIIIEAVSKGESSVFKTDDYSVSVHRNNILILNFNDFENLLNIRLSKKKRSQLFIDEKLIRGNIRVRKVLPSDSFIPFGKKSKVKVSKVLSDKKVPKVLRERMFCLEDDEKIIYIQGAGISDEVKVRDGSVTIYINEENNILTKFYK
ncbi:MAG: tRNA lysidine(34) synthetase TilS [Candidatus Delongbacteria bacterium]|nr:tRNA lysidine(34) synthetase TilS [Candidatus Delongbacteria bacterium]